MNLTTQVLEEVASFSNRTGVGKRRLALAAKLSEDAIRRMGRYRNIQIRPRTAAQIRNAMKEIEYGANITTSRLKKNPATRQRVCPDIAAGSRQD